MIFLIVLLFVSAGCEFPEPTEPVGSELSFENLVLQLYEKVTDKDAFCSFTGQNLRDLDLEVDFTNR